MSIIGRKPYMYSKKMLYFFIKRTRCKMIKSVYFWTGLLSGFIFLALMLQKDEPSGSESFARPWWVLRVFQWHAGASVTAAPTPSPVLQTDCNAILQGDSEEIEITKQMLYMETRSAKPDDFFLNVTANCTGYRQSLQYVNVPASETEKSFPIAYIVTVHKNMQQLQHLLTSIYTPHNVYCIHVDRKSPAVFQKAVRRATNCYKNIFVAAQLESVVYAGFTRLKADLNCMQDLMARDFDWKYVINLAGQEFPLKTNREIVQYLKSLKGQNDIPAVIPTSQLHIDRFRYVHRVSVTSLKMEKTTELKSPPPNNITLYFGSAYYFANRQFVQHVLTSSVAMQLLKWFKDVHSPDEYYWATLQRLPDSPGGSSEGGWASKVRAIKWSYFADIQYPPCQGQYQRNICVYGVGDLNWLSQRPHLFANKFDLNMDHIVLKCLTSWLIDKVQHQHND